MKSPIHTNDSNMIWPQFESSNCNKPEPAPVVAGLFTLEGGRGGPTTILFFGFVYMIQKSSEHNWRRSKIIKADAIYQKFQMQFELSNRNRVAIDNVTIINHC